MFCGTANTSLTAAVNSTTKKFFCQVLFKLKTFLDLLSCNITKIILFVNKNFLLNSLHFFNTIFVMNKKQEPIMLLSAFSLNSFPQLPVNIELKEISKAEAILILKNRGFVSQIGHPSTAEILTEQLGIKIPFNRATLTFTKSSEVIVAQVALNKRLQEGQVLTKEEMLGYPVRYVLIKIKFNN